MDVVSKFIEILIQFTIVLVGFIAMGIGDLSDNFVLSRVLWFLGGCVIGGVLLINIIQFWEKRR